MFILYIILYRHEQLTTPQPEFALERVLLRSHTAYVRQEGVLLGTYIYICSLWGCPHGCIWGPQHVLVS